MEPTNCSSCGEELEVAIIEKEKKVKEIYICLNCGNIVEVQGETE